MESTNYSPTKYIECFVLNCCPDILNIFKICCIYFIIIIANYTIFMNSSDIYDQIILTNNNKSGCTQNNISVWESLNVFLNVLNCMSPKPDLIILTEIWIHSYKVTLYNIDNYKLYYKFRDNYRPAGVYT